MNAIFYVCICLFVCRHSVPVECPQLWCHKTRHWNEVSISLLYLEYGLCLVYMYVAEALPDYYVRFIINQKLINRRPCREGLRVLSCCGIETAITLGSLYCIFLTGNPWRCVCGQSAHTFWPLPPLKATCCSTTTALGGIQTFVLMLAVKSDYLITSLGRVLGCSKVKP